ncbi:hypothetical protein PV327_010898 [Microctonus hyperodae]|uniref:Uncharacterized protein n=1 Tax=Microctonus hyperodae TaxID=165561 RepID=A0AA39F0I1_MICHY|nr:hypothetical protein PV327_010898 [Microctonus hyperodae]
MVFNVKLLSRPTRTSTWRNYRDFDHTLFSILVHSDTLSLGDLLESGSCDLCEVVTSLQQFILVTLSKPAPQGTTTVSKNRVLWLSAELKLKIRQCNQLYRDFKCFKSLLDLQIFKEYRIRLFKEMKDQKHLLYYNKLKSISDPALLRLLTLKNGNLFIDVKDT